MDYKQYKEETEAKYGKAELDFNGEPVNESAKMLAAFRMSKAREAKAAKLAVVQAVVNDKALNLKDVDVPESKLLDKDLKGFDDIERDILKAYFLDRSVKPSVLASRFGRSYQYVAGLLKSQKVQLLINKYFKEDLDEYTKLSLLALVKAKDPRATLASAEYLGVVSKQGIEDQEYKSEDLDVDKFTHDCLTRLADWLVDPQSKSLTLNKPLD